MYDCGFHKSEEVSFLPLPYMYEPLNLPFFLRLSCHRYRFVSAAPSLTRGRLYKFFVKNTTSLAECGDFPAKRLRPELGLPKSGVRTFAAQTERPGAGQEKVAIRGSETYMRLELGSPTWWEADVNVTVEKGT